MRDRTSNAKTRTPSRWTLAFAAALLAALAPGGDAQAPAASSSRGVEIVERLGIPRLCTVPCRVLFAQGETSSPGESFHLRKGAQALPAEWRVLDRWPDGSVRNAAAIVLCAIAPRERQSLLLHPGSSPMPPDFALHPDLQATIPPDPQAAPWFEIISEIEDHTGTVYRARLRYDAGYRAGLKGRLLRTHRFRDYHRGIETPLGRDLFSLTGWLELQSGSDTFAVDLRLGNDYRGPLGAASKGDPATSPEDHPLGGAIRFRRWSIRYRGLRGGVCWEHRVGAGQPRQHMGWTVIDLLAAPPEGFHVLRDGQTLLRRLFFQTKPAVELPAIAQARSTKLFARVKQSLLARPLLPGLRASGAHALGLGLGPSSVPVADLRARIRAELESWSRKELFGPFGSFGDPPAVVAGGLAPDPYAPLLAFYQGADEYLDMAEPRIYQELSLRACHLFDLDVFANPAYRGGLGSGRGAASSLYTDWKVPPPERDAQDPFDPQFFYIPAEAAELYLLTLRPSLRDEIELRAGQAVAASRLPYGLTTRGEARLLRAALASQQVVPDPRVAAHFRGRFRDVVLPAMRSAGEPGQPDYVREQAPRQDTWGPGISWDAPWQAGEFLAAALGAHERWGEPAFLEAAVRAGKFLDSAWHPEVGGRPGGLARYVPLFDRRGGKGEPITSARYLSEDAIRWKGPARSVETTWRENLGLAFDGLARACESPLLSLARATESRGEAPAGSVADDWPAIRERWKAISDALYARVPPDSPRGTAILGLDGWSQAQRDLANRDDLERLCVPNPKRGGK